MSFTVTPRICKAVQSPNWSKFKWFWSNFNMPKPNFWSWWSSQDPYLSYNTSSSYDLSWMTAWMEVNCVFVYFRAESESVNINFTITYKYPNWTAISNCTYNWSWNQSIWSWYWAAREQAWQIWIASWEINQNWTYSITISWSWSHNWSTTVNFTVSNCPDPNQYYSRQWAIWVDWTELKYYVANQFEHSIVWVAWWNVWADKAWAIWIPSDNLIYYIDQYWQIRKTNWNLEIFQWYWDWWSAQSWKTPWCIWMDNEFWWSHIAYIWYDWKKYCTWNGIYPYVYP